MADEDTTKRAVHYMLSRGLAFPLELAEVSGRSRQIIRIWMQEYPTARKKYLKSQWDRALKWAAKRS